MPNWCSNELTVTGPAELLHEFVTAAAGADQHGKALALDFERHAPVPDPDEYDPVSTPLGALLHLRHPGRDTATERQAAAWGTKWKLDADDVHIVSADPADGELTYWFTTASSPADAWVIACGLLHTGLRFELLWGEGGNGVAGKLVIENGDITDEQDLDGDDAVALVTAHDRRHWLVCDDEDDDGGTGEVS